MMKQIFFIIFLFPFSIFSQTEVLVERTSIAEIMDSLLVDYRFHTLQLTRQDSMYFNRFQFSIDEVPEYKPEEYAKRIKDICAIVPMTYNPDVQAWINLYAKRARKQVSLMLGLQHIYFPIIDEIFYKEGIPLELKYLAVVESAFNCNATSPAAAVGLWQFIISTAKLYGLRVDSYIDERRDPVKATYAAARYLKELYKIYNDWTLVIAAYNCGPGRVNMAIRYAGGNTDFWSIKKFLPAETNSYVPAFISATYIFHYPAEHNLYPVWTDFSFNRDTIHVINKQLNLADLARETGADLKELRDLNPELRTNIVPFHSKPYVLRVPAKVYDFAFQNRAYFIGNAYEYKPVAVQTYKPPVAAPPSAPAHSKLTYHRVVAGETPSIIADKYKVSLSDLTAWNNLKGRYIYAGQALKIYTPDLKKDMVAQQPSVGKGNPSNPSKNSSIAKFHKVQLGDTLWDIAMKYEGLTVDKICSLNQMKQNAQLQVGQMLKISE